MSKNWLNILEIKFPLKRGSILSQATDTLLRLQEIQSWYITRNNSNWGLDEIRERDIRISDKLVEILKD